MQVIVALENVIKTYTFPDDTSFQPNGVFNGFITVIPEGGLVHFFNMSYVIAIIPNSKAGR